MPPERDTGRPRRPRWRRAAAAGLLLAAAGAWWWAHRTDSVATRPSVAVLQFEDRSALPGSEWLSTALAEMLSTELAAGGKLRLISGETIARTRQELSLERHDGLTPETLEAIGKSLNAEYVILGSYRVRGQETGREIRLELELRESRRGETVTSVTRTGSESGLFQLVTAVESSLRDALGVDKISFTEERAVRATLSSSPEAFRLYLDGLEKLRSFDALAARRSLERAVTIDPEYALAHAALSRAWSALGYDQQAEDSARRALELATDLPREEYLKIEGRYHEEASSWQQAIETYRQLWRSFPDSVDYGLRLAQAQITAGQAPDALATIAQLHTLASPASDDPRIDLLEAGAAYSLSDYRTQIAACDRAADKARALGASTLVAEALLLKGQGLYRLLDSEAATAAYEEARQLFTAAGDRGKVAQVLSSIANVLYTERDLEGAEELYRRAGAIHREIGHRGKVARMQNNLGNLLYNRGDLAAARTMLEEAVAVGRELGDRHSEAEFLDTLVQVLFLQGDLTAAKELAQEELALYQAIGNREWTAWSYYNLGRVALAAGEVARARELHEEALVMGDELGDAYLTGWVLDALAQVLLAHGDLAEARRLSEDSRAIRLELAGESTLADSWITTARILLELGRPADAEALARNAARAYRRQNMSDEEAAAVAQLARALLDQGRISESGEVLAAARARAAESQNPAVRLTVAMAHARRLAGGGRDAEARRELDRAVAAAAASGLRLLELEARLALGELQMRAAAPSIAEAGRSQLQALAARARDLGCLLIAAKAAVAGVPPRARGPQALPAGTGIEVW